MQIVLCTVQLRCNLTLACKQFTRTRIEWHVLYYTHKELMQDYQMIFRSDF